MEDNMEIILVYNNNEVKWTLGQDMIDEIKEHAEKIDDNVFTAICDLIHTGLVHKNQNKTKKVETKNTRIIK